MFVQIIQGPVADRNLLRRQWERWNIELLPEAIGFLGGTAGITADGGFVASVRFESGDAARRNSQRAEQDAWWRETEKAFDGPVEFSESSDVVVLKEGSNDAGFVQMMQARVNDRARFERIEHEISDDFIRLRPDFIGGMRIWFPGPRLHVVDNFSSEAEARAGEKVEMPARVQQLFGEWMSLLEDTRWHDIADPWLT